MQNRGLGPFHLRYWYNGDQAGGFVLQLGRFKGLRINETQWDWLLETLRDQKDRPVSTL